MAIGDVDGDGKPDLVATNQDLYAGPNNFTVLRNTSVTGTIDGSSFAPKFDFAAAGKPIDVQLADINHDGKLDVVVAEGQGNLVSVWANTATPGAITGASFTGPYSFNTGTPNYNLRINDVNGDGWGDVVVSATNRVVVFENSTLASISLATFNSSSSYTMPGSMRALSSGDLDGDGKPEIVVTFETLNSISILQNIGSARPQISSFTPASGPLGTSVIISGSNFDTTPANNIVYFGSTRATVTAAAPGSLTVTVPAGASHKLISVEKDGFLAYSDEPFDVTFGGSHLFAATSLAAPVNLPTGTAPTGVVYGDLDGDGKADMVVTNLISNSISIYRNTSTSGTITAASYSAPFDLTTGPSPFYAAVDDLDGDGKLEVIVLNYASPHLGIFRNISIPGILNAASFAARVDLAVSNTSYIFATGDLDGDGKQDIAVANHAGNVISIFRNLSVPGTITPASFELPLDLPSGTGPYGIAIRDFDADSKPDIAFANMLDNTVSVIKNLSTPGPLSFGSFAAKVDFATGANPRVLIADDFDGDGNPDLAATLQISGSLTILRNTATPGTIDNTSFAAPADFFADSPATKSTPRWTHFARAASVL